MDLTASWKSLDQWPSSRQFSSTTSRTRSPSPLSRARSPSPPPEVLKLLVIQGAGALKGADGPGGKPTLGPAHYKGSYDEILTMPHNRMEISQGWNVPPKAPDWLLRPRTEYDSSAVKYVTLEEAWESLEKLRGGTAGQTVVAGGLKGTRSRTPAKAAMSPDVLGASSAVPSSRGVARPGTRQMTPGHFSLSAGSLSAASEKSTARDGHLPSLEVAGPKGGAASRSGFGERATARIKRDSSPAAQRRSRDYPAGAATAPRPNDSQLSRSASDFSAMSIIGGKPGLDPDLELPPPADVPWQSERKIRAAMSSGRLQPLGLPPPKDAGGLGDGLTSKTMLPVQKRPPASLGAAVSVAPGSALPVVEGGAPVTVSSYAAAKP